MVNEYQPNSVVAPGETLLEMIQERGMTQADLSLHLGLSQKMVGEIIKGKAPISHGTALALERELGVSAGFWNRYEAAYRASLAPRQMDFATFKHRVESAVPAGTTLNNPGGGTSLIISYSNDKVSYRRGRSTMRVSLYDLFEAYTYFNGYRMSSSDLRLHKPAVFDSQARPAGHSCNCTFLFLALQRMGLIRNVYGRGVSGSPFFVDLSECL